MLLREAKEILRKNGYRLVENVTDDMELIQIPGNIKRKALSLAARNIGVSVDEIIDFIHSTQRCMDDLEFMYETGEHDPSVYADEIERIWNMCIF